jgi:methyltransferase family protein
LQGNLRHVADAGAHITRRVRSICLRTGKEKPVLLDMGFGNGWLLEALVESNTQVSYIGVDVLELFVQRAKAKFAGVENAQFVLADLEEELLLDAGVDVVVNAFNFFEICNLRLAMGNASRYMNEGGRLFMSTIDKTYLILAVSSDWENFHQNLKRYQDIRGVKFDFQRIDLGDGLSESLEYPSVLYSTEDYIDAARTCGLEMKQYEEQPFTGRAVPKIYCHLEFEKMSDENTSVRGKKVDLEAMVKSLR